MIGKQCNRREMDPRGPTGGLVSGVIYRHVRKESRGVKRSPVARSHRIAMVGTLFCVVLWCVGLSIGRLTAKHI